MLTFQFISIGSNLASLIQENKHVILMSLSGRATTQTHSLQNLSCQKQATYMYCDDYNLIN